MQDKKWMMAALAVATAVVGMTFSAPRGALAADVAGAKAGVALSGTVSSAEEGAMEGVLVLSLIHI